MIPPNSNPDMPHDHQEPDVTQAVEMADAEHSLRSPRETTEDAVRAQLALMSGGMASFEWDIPGEVVHCGPRLAEHFGLPPGRETYPIAEFFSVIHPEDVPAIDKAVNRAISEDIDYHMEWRVIRSDGTRWLGGRGRIVERDAQGGALRMLGVNWDITKQKEQEQALKIMAQEMEHRVKNAFAILSALTGIAARRCATPAEMKTMLRGQILALGEAHSLGLSDSKTARLGVVRMADLIRASLKPWAALNHDLDLDEQVKLGAQPAASLSMVLYEVITNASKYGGLADQNGKLSISLRRCADGGAVLKWRETVALRAPRLHGGTGIDGYGTVLLAQATQVLGADLRREFKPDGMEMVMTFPADALIQPQDEMPYAALL